MEDLILSLVVVEFHFKKSTTIGSYTENEWDKKAIADCQAAADQ